MTQPLTAIILAAGYSSRMGAFKPLLSFGGTTVLERSIELFRSAGIIDIRVVIGHRGNDLLPLLKRLNVQPLLNDHYREGMFTSVLTAAVSLTPENGAFFLLPVDIPLVKRETVELLARSFEKSGKGILYPTCRGDRGHPPLIATTYREEIMAWDGYGGLKSLLMRHEADAAVIECEDEGILLDMDTPEDYEQLRDLLESTAHPSRQTCEQLLLERFAADSPVVRHCRAVAHLALLMAVRLNDCGSRFNTVLIKAAALLHDLAKGERCHATVGSEILRGMGYSAVADLIAVHMDLPHVCDNSIDAADLIFLADKLMQSDRFVPLKIRFERQLERHGDNLQIQAIVTRRYENALTIQKRVESIIGASLTDLFQGITA
ncbi:MAG: NTP transferase domain-containing protein [Geobacteraceae bacterium]|nr:NTP transferase domain-containing protein [Geobacteraceae bacterium]